MELTGSPVVGPSVTTFYFDSATSGFTAHVTSFFTSLINDFPGGLSFSIPNTGDLIQDTDGAITGSYTDGTASTVTSSSAGLYVLGTGARIRWGTAGIVGRRRSTGSTFLVPLIENVYGTDGLVTPTVAGQIKVVSDALISALPGALLIWSRPVKANATHVPPIAARVGSSHAVLSSSVPRDVSWLRTRRT